MSGFFAPESPDEQVIAHKRVRERHGETGRGRARRIRAFRGGLNITAMIDVVFLLLIYFMAATSFKLGEEVFRLDLPERGQAMSAPDPFELDEEPLRIGVSSTGSHAEAYRLRLAGPYEQPMSFDDLLEFLRARLISPGAAGGLFAPGHPIIIEAPASPGGARWEHVVETFSTAVRAGYTNISFARAP